MRAFTDEQVEQMVHDAGDEPSRRVILELRRMYAEEDARAKMEGAAYTLLMSAHQQLHGAARTFEGALKMLAPPEPQATATPQEPARKRPRVLMDEQPQ